MRRMSKSAVRVAREALAAGRAALPDYGRRYSRQDSTQPQLFALLVLRQFLRTDYRGSVTLVAEWSELRSSRSDESAALLDARLCLAPAPRRGGGGWGAFRHAQAALLGRARTRGLIDRKPVAAVDATGLETRHVSAYFGMQRAREGHRQRAWPKLTAVVHTASHLILGAVPGVGPSQDSPDFAPAMRQAAGLIPVDTVLADASYDAEHNPPVQRRTRPAAGGDPPQSPQHGVSLAEDVASPCHAPALRPRAL
jgi:hypothetical protein